MKARGGSLFGCWGYQHWQAVLISHCLRVSHDYQIRKLDEQDKQGEDRVCFVFSRHCAWQ